LPAIFLLLGFVVLLIASPFIAIKKYVDRDDARKIASQAANGLLGIRVPNRLVSMEICERVLASFHHTGAESMFVLFLDNTSTCIHVEVRFGNSTSVAFSTTEIINIAIRVGAIKLVLAHNHPNECSTPSDTDIRHTAVLVSSLPSGIEIVDDLVWCQRSVKSILNTRRFKAMIKAY
jgi:DNA repair protein RadC